MPGPETREGSGELSARQWFRTTHWSVVLTAQRFTPDSEAALAKLCETYWYPLYAYVRRRGSSAEDAEDLTQSFFAAFLEKDYLARADPTRGRFRTFLLTAVENFLHNQWDRATALKRGGGKKVLSWDAQSAEERYLNEPVDNTTPETLFEKRWAATLLEQAEFAATGRVQFFGQLRPYLWGDENSKPYADLGRQLNMSVSALKVAVHRLRRRYQDLLRLEIARTVADPAEVDDEIRHLIKIMSE